MVLRREDELLLERPKHKLSSNVVVRSEDELLLEHLLLLKVQIPPRPHRARPPVPGHYTIACINIFSNMVLYPESHLQQGFYCCYKKGGRR